METATAKIKSDFFNALNIPRKRMQLSERQVFVELHPSNSGPLAKLGKAPVLLAQELVVTITPDASAIGGARIEAEINVDGIGVSSPELLDSDKERIKHKIRRDLLNSDVFPLILFQGDELSVQPDGSSILIKGALTIHGQSATQYILFKKTGRGAYEANIEVCQTTFGLHPLSAFMGGLKSDDRLKIRCLVYIP